MAGVQALRAAPNYAWTTTTEMPGVPFAVASMRGQADAGGWVVLETEFEGKQAQAAALGRERVFRTQEEGGEAVPEAERLKGDEQRAGAGPP